MDKQDLIVVRGDYILQLLAAICSDTLSQVRADIGKMTFANSDLIRIVEKEISIRDKRAIMESLDTIEVDECIYGFMDYEWEA